MESYEELEREFLSALQQVLVARTRVEKIRERLFECVERERLGWELPNDVLSKLSPRQRQVSDLIIKGLSNQEIANELHISLFTARYHATGIYNKLSIGSRFELRQLVKLKKT